MGIEKKASMFKQAHQLAAGDRIAFHYGDPSATVIQKVTADQTVLIVVVNNDEPVRYAPNE